MLQVTFCFMLALQKNKLVAPLEFPAAKVAHTVEVFHLVLQIKDQVHLLAIFCSKLGLPIFHLE